jgi:energy-converting hydrogenase Eha subunit E
MRFDHRLLPRESLFWVVGGLNIAFGVALFAGKGFPRAELAGKLSSARDPAASAADLELLRGADVGLRGKGVILAGVGSLILCAAASGDRPMLKRLAAMVAVGDVALVGMLLAEKRRDPAFPRLDTEAAAVKFGLIYAAVEAVALGAYVAVCK